MGEVGGLMKKYGIIVLVLALSGAYYTEIASALDVGDPDISVKILAPEGFMPDSTYFIGVKYIVNATFRGANPGIDPEIIFAHPRISS